MRFFFRSKKFKIIVSVFLVVSLLSVIVGVIGTTSSPVGGILGTIISPFQKGASAVSDYFTDLSNKFDDNSKLIKENDALKKENAELANKLVDYENAINQNKFYEEFLEIKERNPDYQFASAKIIAKDSTNDFKNFTIDKGLLDGISVNDPVITSDGLVGYVSVAAPTYCNVQTVFDNRIKIGGIDSRSSDAGIISGTVKLSAEGKTMFNNLSRNSSVTVGDYITTSGGGVFPKGLIIGKISEIKTDTASQSIYAEIIPTVDFDNIRDVMVITYFSGQGVFAGDTDTGDAK